MWNFIAGCLVGAAIVSIFLWKAVRQRNWFISEWKAAKRRWTEAVQELRKYKNE